MSNEREAKPTDLSASLPANLPARPYWIPTDLPVNLPFNVSFNALGTSTALSIQTAITYIPISTTGPSTSTIYTAPQMTTSKAIWALRNKETELKSDLSAARTLLSIYSNGNPPKPEIPASILNDYLQFAALIITELNNRRVEDLQEADLLGIPDQLQENYNIEKGYYEEMVEVVREVRHFGVGVCLPLQVPAGFEEFWRKGEEGLNFCHKRMLELIQTGLLRS